MRALFVVIVVTAGLTTLQASAQAQTTPVYFTYFAQRANPSTGIKDCDLGFFLPDDAEFRMTLQVKDGDPEIDFSFEATKYSDLILDAQPPRTESVEISMLWPNTGDRKTVEAQAYLLPTSGKVDQTFIADKVHAGLLYELANSGSDVLIRFTGSRGHYDTSLPQRGLNGLQKFTANCL